MLKDEEAKRGAGCEVERLLLSELLKAEFLFSRGPLMNRVISILRNRVWSSRREKRKKREKGREIEVSPVA